MKQQKDLDHLTEVEATDFVTVERQLRVLQDQVREQSITIGELVRMLAESVPVEADTLKYRVEAAIDAMSTAATVRAVRCLAAARYHDHDRGRPDLRSRLLGAVRVRRQVAGRPVSGTVHRTATSRASSTSASHGSGGTHRASPRFEFGASCTSIDPPRISCVGSPW